MDAKQVIREIMKKTGTSQEKLAEKSGLKRQSNVTGILNRYASLRVDKLDQLISAMGYKIVIMPDSVNIRSGWYEVDAATVGTEKDDIEKSVPEKSEKAKKAVLHERP